MRFRSFWAGLSVFILGMSVGGAFAQAQSTPDPLFVKMAGVWAGRGERVQFSEAGVPSRSVPVEVEVESVVEGDRLISTNSYREGFPSDVGYREYERVYWIRHDASASAGSERAYVLGGGRGEPVNGAPAVGGTRGRLVGSHLTVIQDVPAQPPMRVLGETEFLDDQTTVYRETITWGDRVLTRSQIRYVRGQNF